MNEFYSQEDPWDNPMREVEQENVEGEKLNEELTNQNND